MNDICTFAFSFHTSCVVDNVQYMEGSGSSKKLAKKEASEKALKAIFDKGKKKLKEANFFMVKFYLYSYQRFRLFLPQDHRPDNRSRGGCA